MQQVQLKIVARYGGISDTTVLWVTGQIDDIISIEIIPNGATIEIGTTLEYKAIGTYSDSSLVDITSLVTWGSTNPGVATISNNGDVVALATAHAAGATKITVTYKGIGDTTVLSVTGQIDNIISIEIIPNGATIEIGTTLEYKAIGTYSDSSLVDITSLVTWGSTNRRVATIFNNGEAVALATAHSAGATKITATYEGIGDTTNLDVTDQIDDIISIEIIPNGALIEIGRTLDYKAIGTYSDSSQADITSLVTWGSTNTRVATIRNNGDEVALVTAHAVGRTKIYATFGSISDTTALSVTERDNQIEDIIKKHVDSGRITAAIGDSLLRKITRARNKVENGKIIVARKKINAFINEVETIVKSGRITSRQGRKLINLANKILE